MKVGSTNTPMNNHSAKKPQHENKIIENLQNSIRMIDKSIESVKKSKHLDPAEKRQKIERLQKQKKEVERRVQEAKVNQELRKVEKEMQEAQEAKEKHKSKYDTAVTPQEEIEAELGLNEMPTNSLISASQNLDSINKRIGIKEGLKQDSKIYMRQIHRDIGNGQKIDGKDFRVKLVKHNNIHTNKIEGTVIKGLLKTNKDLKVGADEAENVIEKNDEINENVENRQDHEDVKEVNDSDEKKVKFVKVGEHVDVKV